MKYFLFILSASFFLHFSLQNVNAKTFTNLDSEKTKRTAPKPRLSALDSIHVGDDEDNDVKIQNDENLAQEGEDGADTAMQEDGKYEGHYKVGNGYEVFGVNYYPQDYEDYDEVGIASWYGDDFHGKATANGEVYKMRDLTAAHPTLPLPSIVRVTNLDNDKVVVVRVNDRGPFAKNRIIDVSQKAAEILEFRGKGTAHVRVELLQNETKQFVQKLNLKKE